jgi:sugar phosphate isomerase/epimerase
MSCPENIRFLEQPFINCTTLNQSPLNRRNFLELTCSSATLIMLPSLDIFSGPLPTTTRAAGYQLKVLATNWGFGGSLEDYCARVKKAGYEGIEIWWPLAPRDQEELFALLSKNKLEVGFLCGSGHSQFTEHLEAFKKMTQDAANNPHQRPLYLNCHSGKDYFSYEQNIQFIEHTERLTKETGIKICHETHRSRILFAAPVARTYLEAFPGLRITFDVSHWCNVSESLLQDQQATLDMALPRVDHIHARIGHPEGPQVSDPRAPEWADAVKAHVAWWDRVVAMKKERGEVMTFLTEFGPPDYMPTLPYTRQPLADQWAINVHMMELLRKRYS